MSGNLSSNNIENDVVNVDAEDNDYKDLIVKLKEIKLTITQLEKNLNKY